MVHTFHTTVSVEWHDLMEDPNDLPDDLNRLQYAITRNKKTGELGSFFFFDNYEDVFCFDPQYRIWKAEQGEGDYYQVLWFRSYGQEYTSDGDFDSDFEVIAWSYGPDNTAPGYNPLTKGELKQ